MSSWIKRKDTKVVHVGDVAVGGYNPISIQSMTNTNTKDIVSTVKQINDLDVAGADIVRVSVPGYEEANAFKEINYESARLAKKATKKSTKTTKE